MRIKYSEFCYFYCCTACPRRLVQSYKSNQCIKWKRYLGRTVYDNVKYLVNSGVTKKGVIGSRKNLFFSGRKFKKKHIKSSFFLGHILYFIKFSVQIWKVEK